MPISGKNRRTKTRTIARGVAAAGAGGAVIALPLLGATGANAAPAAAPQSVSAATTHAAPAKPVAQKQAATTTYSVVSGDWLSKIAAEHKIEGGWQKLYQDNREVVGDDPSLILPGVKLTLGGKASGDSAPMRRRYGRGPPVEGPRDSLDREEVRPGQVRPGQGVDRGGVQDLRPGRSEQ